MEFAELAECKSMTVLSVDMSRSSKERNTGCTQQFVHDIAAVVGHLPKLCVFRLNASRAGVGLPAVVALLRAIGKASKSLYCVELLLDENEIGGDCLTTTLANLTRMRHFVLSLRKSDITCLSTASASKPENHLLQQFGESRDFVHMDLAENAIGDEGAACVASFLARPAVQLELLLDHCSIGTHGATSLARRLELAQSYRVTINDNPLSEGCFTCLLPVDGKTIHIVARNSGLRDANVHTLVNRLLAGGPKNSVVLDLAKNHITDWGAKQLARCLGEMSHVPFVLILNDNQVSDCGLKVLQDQIHSRSLVKMDIQIKHKLITDVGVADVPMLYQTHPHVSISLKGNLHDHTKHETEVALWKIRGPMHQLIRSGEATNTFPLGLNIKNLKRKWAFPGKDP